MPNIFDKERYVLHYENLQLYMRQGLKLMNNTIYGKGMEILRNRINIKLVNNDNDYLKCTSKPSYMSQKIFDNDLVAIRKSKLTLKINKPAYIECVFGNSVKY